MNAPLGYAILAAVFVVTFICAVSSSRARTTAIPFVAGISAGLFSVQIENVHLFTPIVLAWFLARAGHKETQLGWRVFALPIACVPIALTVFLGDLVVNPGLALQLMALAASAAMLAAGWDVDLRQPILSGLLCATSASATLGLLQVAHLVPTDLWHVEVSALGRPTGFYPEPDWLGMFAAVGTLLAWRLPMHPTLRIALVLVNLSALILAFARAAWLGAGVAALIAILVWFRTRSPGDRLLGNGKTGRLRALCLTLFALVVATTALPDLRRDLLTRLGSTLTAQSDDVSAQARVQQNRTLSALADSAPWHGHGLSSSGRVGVSGIFYSDQSANSVASNWALGLWVDAAWLAVPFFLLIAFLVCTSLKRIEGMLLIAVLTNSFFSNALFQPVTWMLLGVIVATTSSLHDTRSREERPARRPRGRTYTTAT